MATHNKTVDKGSTVRGKGVNLWPSNRVDAPTDIPGRGRTNPYSSGVLPLRYTERSIKSSAPSLPAS